MVSFGAAGRADFRTGVGAGTGVGCAGQASTYQVENSHQNTRKTSESLYHVFLGDSVWPRCKAYLLWNRNRARYSVRKRKGACARLPLAGLAWRPQAQVTLARAQVLNLKVTKLHGGACHHLSKYQPRQSDAPKAETWVSLHFNCVLKVGPVFVFPSRWRIPEPLF